MLPSLHLTLLSALGSLGSGIYSHLYDTKRSYEQQFCWLISLCKDMRVYEWCP